MTLSQVNEDIAEFLAWKNAQELDKISGNFDHVFHEMEITCSPHSLGTQSMLEAYQLDHINVSKKAASPRAKMGERSARKAVRATKRAEREVKKANKFAKRATKKKEHASAALSLTASGFQHEGTCGEVQSHDGPVVVAKKVLIGTPVTVLRENELLIHESRTDM